MERIAMKWFRGYFSSANTAARMSKTILQTESMFCYMNTKNNHFMIEISENKRYEEGLFLFFSTKHYTDCKTLQSIFKEAKYYKSETTI